MASRIRAGSKTGFTAQALEDASLTRPATATDPALARHRAAVRARLLRSGLQRPGPGSVTWRINREAILIAGWGRAILLQLAHPAIAAGVHDHSAFRGSLAASVKRLRGTVGAMLALTFGDTDEMITAAARINAVHDRVRGRIANGSGESYSAHDPEAQRWVHASMLASIPLAHELLVGPLTRPERDQYCLESAHMEPLMGMPAGWLPRDSAGLDTYMRDMLAGDQLVVTDTSRLLAQALLYPLQWYVAWPAFRAMQRLTIGTLPASIRQAYGFDWTPSDARALDRWTALLRTSRRLAPRVAREWPIARRRVACDGIGEVKVDG